MSRWRGSGVTASNRGKVDMCSVRAGKQKDSKKRRALVQKGVVPFIVPELKY